jgi:hypothetical protein
MSVLLGLFTALALSASGNVDQQGLPSSGVPRISGWIRAPELSELSGLAASNRRSNRLWAINDSGSPAQLLALTTEGHLEGIVTVLDAPNRDWEDLASYREDNKSWLLVADSGDNNARYPDHTLYIFREPNRTSGTVRPKRKIRYRFAEGMLDSESVAVDARAGLIYIVSKRIRPSLLFSLPLHPTTDEVLVARLIGPLGGIQEPSLDHSRHNTNFLRYAGEPTAIDLSCDGHILALLTYSRAYFYRREGASDFSDALHKPVDSITLPPLPQAEALAYGRDCKRLYIGSEQPPTPLLAYPVRP